MKIDNLRRYIDLRDSLVREKTTLEHRLREINDALGQDAGRLGGPAASESVQKQPATSNKSSGAARRGRRSQGGISLRDAVIQVLQQGGPQTKEEILAGVKGLGYRFSTNNPLNSLGVILYGKNPKFKNENGRFSLGNSPASQPRSSNGGGSGGGAFARKKRQLSPEARERIAAAQRERWSKAKSRR